MNSIEERSGCCSELKIIDEIEEIDVEQGGENKLQTCYFCFYKRHYLRLTEAYITSIEKRMRSDRILLKSLLQNIFKLCAVQKTEFLTDVIDNLISIGDKLCEDNKNPL